MSPNEPNLRRIQHLSNKCTPPVYLPELRAYLDDLLRTRERLAATIDGVDDWARVDATPTEEEITRIRRLINSIKGDIAGLDDTERASIDDAVAVVRRHRATHSVPLGIPVLAPATIAPAPARGHRMTNPRPKSTRPHRSARPMLDGRRDDSLLRRQRVLAILDKAAVDGAPISTSAIARAAGVDRTFLYRHRDLLEKIHALQADPAISADTGPAVTRASPQADLLAAHERAARLNTRIHHLEKRLSEALGEQIWRESGLGAPTDIDALHQRINQLEQHNLDPQQQLDERDDDLVAARATNRELMARLNTSARPDETRESTLLRHPTSP